MKTYEKYGITVGQKYVPADGSINTLVVTDVESFADCDDVVVYDTHNRLYRRIDCFILAMARYSLPKE